MMKIATYPREIKNFRVTLIAYDPKDNFVYECEAKDSWDAFLKQPSSVPVISFLTWRVDDIAVDRPKQKMNLKADEKLEVVSNGKD